jgi:hypothetical protein
MSTDEPRALAHQPGEAKTVALGAYIVTFLARREDTAVIYSLTAITVAPPPTPGPPLHIHKDAHEAKYVLEKSHCSPSTFSSAICLSPLLTEVWQPAGRPSLRRSRRFFRLFPKSNPPFAQV